MYEISNMGYESDDPSPNPTNLHEWAFRPPEKLINKQPTTDYKKYFSLLFYNNVKVLPTFCLLSVSSSFVHHHHLLAFCDCFYSSSSWLSEQGLFDEKKKIKMN